MVLEGVTKIGNDAFHSFNEVETIVLPASLKSIGTRAFPGYGMEKTKVLFNGTEEQWKDCYIGSENRLLEYSEITFPNITPTEPTVSPTTPSVTEPSQEPVDKEKGSSVVVIAAVVIFIILAADGGFILLRRRKHKKQE